MIRLTEHAAAFDRQKKESANPASDGLAALLAGAADAARSKLQDAAPAWWKSLSREEKTQWLVSDELTPKDIDESVALQRVRNLKAYRMSEFLHGFQDAHRPLGVAGIGAGADKVPVRIGNPCGI